jgi:hypothetical protein
MNLLSKYFELYIVYKKSRIHQIKYHKKKDIDWLNW